MCGRDARSKRCRRLPLFNPIIAMAADTVIVDADNIVPIGVISPDHIVYVAVYENLVRDPEQDNARRRRSWRQGCREKAR